MIIVSNMDTQYMGRYYIKNCLLTIHIVTLDHNSHKLHEYICSNSQQSTIGQNYRFLFYAKNQDRILEKSMFCDDIL